MLLQELRCGDAEEHFIVDDSLVQVAGCRFKLPVYLGFVWTCGVRIRFPIKPVSQWNRNIEVIDNEKHTCSKWSNSTPAANEATAYPSTPAANEATADPGASSADVVHVSIVSSCCAARLTAATWIGSCDDSNLVGSGSHTTTHDWPICLFLFFPIILGLFTCNSSTKNLAGMHENTTFDVGDVGCTNSVKHG